jgi:hypothetical protein
MNPHNQAIFTSNIQDAIVISFTYNGKPTKVVVRDLNINDISDLIVRFGIDSFVLNTTERYYLTQEHVVTIQKAILKAYPVTH